MQCLCYELLLLLLLLLLQVAHLGLKLAQSEFIVATGGGPGAMEVTVTSTNN
jgi:predicted Rossmann-fold nucleotide-binding protein